MKEEELKRILKLHKNWLNKEEGGVRADLRHADLKYADLKYADLRGADLKYADLRHADLRRADLRHADLRGANLSNAELRHADLRGANLSNANISNAKLDYSCLPLWCGSLKVHMDDRQVKQLLYHTLSIVKHSENVSTELKEKLLTQNNLLIANEFHRVNDCGEL